MWKINVASMVRWEVLNNVDEKFVGDLELEAIHKNRLHKIVKN